MGIGWQKLCHMTAPRNRVRWVSSPARRLPSDLNMSSQPHSVSPEKLKRAIAGHRPASKPSYRPGSHLPHRYSGGSPGSAVQCFQAWFAVSSRMACGGFILRSANYIFSLSIRETYSTLSLDKIQSLALPAKELAEQVTDRPASSIVRSREFASQFASQLDGLT